MSKMIKFLTFLLLLAVPASAQVTNVPCNQLPALTGDVTTSAGGCATTITAPVSTAKGGTGVTSGTSRIVSPATSVNFAVTATDFAVNTPLPSGFTQLCIVQLFISGASGDISTATFGVNTASGGGGVAVLPAGTAITVTTGSANTNNNQQQINATNLATEAYTPTAGQIFVRTGATVAQTAKFQVSYIPCP